MAQDVAQDIPDAPPAADSASSVDAAYTPAGSKSLQTGVATFYARSFQGRRTASGEAYDMHALSAAHRTLPLGSYVRVTSLSTRRSVVVRVNDRGPFVSGRIIDLSFAAATMLGIQHSGSASVTLERVSSRDSSRDSQAEPVVASRPVKTARRVAAAHTHRTVNHAKKGKHVTKARPVKHAKFVKKPRKSVHRVSHK
jgi:rare lipoprotein A